MLKLFFCRLRPRFPMAETENLPTGTVV
jgi:hypothetical protein